MLQRLRTASIFFILLLAVTLFASGVAEAQNPPNDPGNDPGGQPPANRAPEAVGTIPGFTLTVGGVSGTVNLGTYFSDPEGEALTYTATSSDTSIATINKSPSNVLTVIAKAAGTATITVVARDPGDLTAEQQFSVTVKTPPTPVGTIPDQTVKVGGTPATVDVSANFSDSDGDTLTYTASSSDTAKATVSVSSATVTITAVAAGTATVTVTATDPGGLTATQSISVTVTQNRAPTVTRSISPITAPVGTTGDVDLSLDFSDPDGDTLTYAVTSSNTAAVSGSVSGSTLTITAVGVGKATLTATATDPGGLSATLSVNFTVIAQSSTADAIPGLSSTERSILVQLLTYDTLIFNELHNGSDDAKDWLELRNVSATDLLLDDWHLTIQTSSGEVIVPFSAGTRIPAGEVLLLTNTEIVTGEVPILSVIAEAFALPQADFTLILRSPTAFGDIAGNYMEGGHPETPPASTEDTTWLHIQTEDVEGEPAQTTPALTVETVWYRTQPIVFGYRAEAWSESIYQDGTGTPGYRHPDSGADLNNDGVVNILDLVLVASQFGMTDTSADLNADGTVNIQDLVVVANAFGDVAGAPGAQQSTASVVNQWLQLARQNASSVVETSLPEGFSYERGIFTLEQLARAFIPETTALLANYPNPFNPETWIPYQLAKASEVTVTIYAADGSVVRTLALGHRDAGMYKNRSQAAYWDGTNALGETVASGVYFYTLTAGEFTATRKMLILK